jgi:hypothetical protein
VNVNRRRAGVIMFDGALDAGPLPVAILEDISQNDG